MMGWMLVQLRFGLVVLGTVVGSSAWAESFRCDSELISEGDTAVELKAHCGVPDEVIVRTRLIASGFVGPQATVLVQPSRRSGTAQALTAPPVRTVRYVREEIQTWLYQGDQTSFARLITLARGKVLSIDSIGPLELNPDPRCVDGRFRTGTSEAIVQLACGEPDDRSAWEEELEVQVSGFLERRRVQRERWVYNPGPGRLLRLLEFADGKLQSIKTGGRSP